MRNCQCIWRNINDAQTLNQAVRDGADPVWVVPHPVPCLDAVSSCCSRCLTSDHLMLRNWERLDNGDKWHQLGNEIVLPEALL